MLDIRSPLLIKPFSSTSPAVKEFFAGVAAGEGPAAVADFEADFAHMVIVKGRWKRFVVVME